MVYTLTNETTGEVLASFPTGIARTVRGALKAAAHDAARRAREGARVLLTGADVADRLYAPEWVPSAPSHGWRGYRIRCASTDCPNWIHPVRGPDARRANRPARCRACDAKSPERRARALATNERRWGKVAS